MERAGWPPNACVWVENQWADLVDQRKPLDDAVLASPITDLSDIGYKLRIARRLIELEPSLGPDILRRIAEQCEEFNLLDADAAA